MDTTPKTVLVVDDDAHIVHIIKHKLEESGFNVVLATNGRFAYKVACRTEIHIVLADYQMPGGDGIELAKQLAANPDLSDLPVIMITGHAHRLTEDDLANTGIRCVLVKPFSPSTLLEKVRNFTDSTPDPGQRAAA